MSRSLIYIINQKRLLFNIFLNLELMPPVYNPAAMQPEAGCFKNQSDREFCKQDS